MGKWIELSTYESGTVQVDLYKTLGGKKKRVHSWKKGGVRLGIDIEFWGFKG